MKHICCVIVIAAGLAASVPAQNRTGPETLALSGTLEVLNGRIALRQGDTVYYVTGIQGLVGFVDGLREGAQVDLEGYVFPRPQARPRTESAASVYQVTKLTLNQKSYELPPAPAFSQARPPDPGRSPGYTMPRRDPRNRPPQRDHCRVW